MAVAYIMLQGGSSATDNVYPLIRDKYNNVEIIIHKGYLVINAKETEWSIGPL